MKPRLITKKPVSDTKLTFAPMGAKPGIQKAVPEDGPIQKKKTKKIAKVSPFAKKAAAALAGKV